MVAVLPERLAGSLDAIGRVLVNPDIRRIQVAWALTIAAESAVLVALLVVAHRAAGPAGVGLIVLAQSLPAACGAPLTATLGDRYPRERLLPVVALLRAVILLGLGLAALAGAPLPVLAALAALEGIAATMPRPLQSSLLPACARTVEESVAANVASSTGEALGVLVGPALAGILLAVSEPSAVLVAGAAAMLAAAAILVRVRPMAQLRLRRREHAGPLRATVTGVRVLAERRDPRLIVALFAVQTFVRGILGVLLVVAAIELLGMGEPGVGLLGSAMGAGGLLGAVAAVVVVGGRRLGPFVCLGLVLWGAPIGVVGLAPDPLVATVALAAVGVGNAALDVSGLSLLQRTVPNEVRTRVLGLVDALAFATIAAGSVVAPLLVAAFGVRGALVAAGLVLPVVAVLAWRRLRVVDETVLVPERQLALLRGVPMFAPLSLTVLEQLAASLVPVRHAAAETIIAEGEAGDRFYLVDEGRVDVAKDGRLVRTMGPGSYVGEIALLRDVPRTATVRAATDVRLFALERDDFLAAITGNTASGRAAESVIEARLAGQEGGAG